MLIIEQWVRFHRFPLGVAGGGKPADEELLASFEAAPPALSPDGDVSVFEVEDAGGGTTTAPLSSSLSSSIVMVVGGL